MLITLFALALLAQPGAAPSDLETLRALERALVDTLATRSRADMERLLADDYVLRGAPDIDRETWIREALARCWGTRFDIDDFRARIEGDAAIASFILTFYVHPETCAPGVLRSLVTDVWTREDGRWRLRVRHSSAPPAGGLAAQFGVVPERPPRWVLSSELSMVATAGNASTRTLGLAAEFTHQSDRTASRIQASYVSSEAGAVTSARATTFQARHGFKLQPALEVFGRVGYARDRFAGIGNRASLDLGFGYTTGRERRHRLTVEGAGGFTSEDRIPAETLRFGAGTGTIRYIWQMAAGSTLQDELSLVADFGEARNWRATNALGLTLGLTHVLSLKVSSGVEYRNLPVPGFRRTDLRTSAALVLVWRGPPRAP